jgi:hypothetical protein
MGKPRATILLIQGHCTIVDVAPLGALLLLVDRGLVRGIGLQQFFKALHQTRLAMVSQSHEDITSLYLDMHIGTAGRLIERLTFHRI